MSLQQPVYINAAYAVSPQVSFEQMLQEPVRYNGDRLACVEPDYTKYVDAKLIRRMSRIIKMGVAAASEALQQAEIKEPDAIITGTAYGCLADTEQFLSRMVEFKETLLSPTAFIQSTHNTVAAQIALMLQCHSYNNTYVHRGASFESALTDARSLLEEGDAKYVLVGAADEIIDKSHAILKRFGLYKTSGDNLSLIGSGTKGTMVGEGAAFFVLSTDKQKGKAVALSAFENLYKPQRDAADIISNFLVQRELAPSAIDLVIMGNNGDEREDRHYEAIQQQLFSDHTVITYKQFCGEYPTAAAFAVWMAYCIINRGVYQNKPVKRVLIYNNYMQHYPVLYLLSAC